MVFTGCPVMFATTAASHQATNRLAPHRVVVASVDANNAAVQNYRLVAFDRDRRVAEHPKLAIAAACLSQDEPPAGSIAHGLIFYSSYGYDDHPNLKVRRALTIGRVFGLNVNPRELHG
jgi:hypothetical protein